MYASVPVSVSELGNPDRDRGFPQLLVGTPGTGYLQIASAKYAMYRGCIRVLPLYVRFGTNHTISSIVRLEGVGKLHPHLDWPHYCSRSDSLPTFSGGRGRLA